MSSDPKSPKAVRADRVVADAVVVGVVAAAMNLREPVRAEERPATSARRPVRDEDNMDDDDDLADEDVELSDFGDLDEEAEFRADAKDLAVNLLAANALHAVDRAEAWTWSGRP